MKITTLFVNSLIIVLFSFNAGAGNNELIEAIKHTQKATIADNAKDVAIHAENAKKHANTAKTDKNINIDGQKIDMGIVFLDQAISYGEKGQTAAAKNAAADASINFLNASKNQFQ